MLDPVDVGDTDRVALSVFPDVSELNTLNEFTGVFDGIAESLA